MSVLTTTPVLAFIDEIEGTPVSSSPSVLHADSLRQMNPSGSPTPSFVCSVKKGSQGTGGMGEITAATLATITLSKSTYMLVQDNTVKSTEWIVDSGANICIINDKRWFTELFQSSFSIDTASSESL